MKCTKTCEQIFVAFFFMIACEFLLKKKKKCLICTCMPVVSHMFCHLKLHEQLFFASVQFYINHGSRNYCVPLVWKRVIMEVHDIDRLIMRTHHWQPVAMTRALARGRVIPPLSLYCASLQSNGSSRCGFEFHLQLQGTNVCVKHRAKPPFPRPAFSGNWMPPQRPVTLHTFFCQYYKWRENKSGHFPPSCPIDPLRIQRAPEGLI